MSGGNTPPDPAVLRELIERVEAGARHSQSLVRKEGPDYALIEASGFVMMTQNPADMIALFDALPDILASLRAHTSTPTMVENGNG